jgi:hypothetical protein
MVHHLVLDDCPSNICCLGVAEHRLDDVVIRPLQLDCPWVLLCKILNLPQTTADRPVEFACDYFQISDSLEKRKLNAVLDAEVV